MKSHDQSEAGVLFFSDLDLEYSCPRCHALGDGCGVRAVKKDRVLILDILDLDDDILRGAES